MTWAQGQGDALPLFLQQRSLFPKEVRNEWVVNSTHSALGEQLPSPQEVKTVLEKCPAHCSIPDMTYCCATGWIPRPPDSTESRRLASGETWAVAMELPPSLLVSLPCSSAVTFQTGTSVLFSWFCFSWNRLCCKDCLVKKWKMSGTN